MFQSNGNKIEASNYYFYVKLKLLNLIATYKFDSNFKNNHLQAIMKQNDSLKVILYGEI